MKFAICKGNGERTCFDDDTYIFTLYSNKKSTIFSSLYDLWRRISDISIPPVYEDLFVFGLSIFAIDKRMSRALSQDNWSRDIDVSIPVSDLDLWNNTKHVAERMLSFLSGDNWKLRFHQSSNRFSMKPIRRDRAIEFSGYDAVCLFSGGLDSFCGAINLAHNGYSLCLLGHNEYPKLRLTQTSMAHTIQKEFPGKKVSFFDFTANARSPKNVIGSLGVGENTCRSRSILFLCAAISMAGIIGHNTPIYIPENGFISINVPLTQGRSGSCSTRTTHPFFIDCYRQLLSQLGLAHEIFNPFEFMTKREVVSAVKEQPAFLQKYRETISCAHPCIPRYKKLPYPKNCGYCYPCIIRKTSLLDLVDGNDQYSHLPFRTLNELMSSDKGTTNDLKAILSSVHRSYALGEHEIERLIATTGPVPPQNLGKHARVYKDTMNDLLALLEREFDYKEGGMNDVD